jgi:glycosyltransferase involved in cell wall biosynthesis
MKLRLLYLTHNLVGLGGSYQRSMGLARAMAARGHTVTLMGGRPSPGLRAMSQSIDGVQVVAPPDVAPRRIRNGGLSPMDLLGRLILVRDLSIDLVHAFDHRPCVSLPAWFLKRRRQLPLVSDWADLWGYGGVADTRSRALRHSLGGLDHWAERAWRRHATGVTAASRHLAELASKAGVDPARCLLLPAGCSVEAFEQPGKSEARRRLGLPISAKVVAHTGYAAYDEPLLTATLVRLLASEPEAMVLTTGRPPHQLGEQLVAIGRVTGWRHLGTLPHRELGVVMSAADVLLLPFSRRTINLGRYPNKLGDYLTAGRPIVTNPTGDVAELVGSHRIGLLAEETPQSMAAAISQLFDNPGPSYSMGERARQLATGPLSWSTLAEKVEAFYVTLTG